MNPTIKAILERRSIRSFKSEPAANEQIEILKEVALASPSAVNSQPWHFSFVFDQELLAEISSEVLESLRRNNKIDALNRMKARHESIFYGAPLVVFISVPEQKWCDIDAGIAVQNLAIAAQSMGLGSCIIGMAGEVLNGPGGTLLAKRLDFPPEYRFVISIAIGHPAIGKEAHNLDPEKISVIS